MPLISIFLLPILSRIQHSTGRQVFIKRSRDGSWNVRDVGNDWTAVNRLEGDAGTRMSDQRFKLRGVSDVYVGGLCFTYHATVNDLHLTDRIRRASGAAASLLIIEQTLQRLYKRSHWSKSCVSRSAAVIPSLTWWQYRHSLLFLLAIINVTALRGLVEVCSIGRVICVPIIMRTVGWC